MILEQQPNAEVTLVRGGAGVFDIERDGALVYSKASTGRFPEDSEVRALTEL